MRGMQYVHVASNTLLLKIESLLGSLLPQLAQPTFITHLSFSFSFLRNHNSFFRSAFYLRNTSPTLLYELLIDSPFCFKLPVGPGAGIHIKMSWKLW